MKRHPEANCEACPLMVGGKFVASNGPDEAQLAFVGEAPGIQEARTGQQFIGPSGRLLDIVLAFHKIKREKVFLTNATLCRPADGSAPPKTAIDCCRPRLIDELTKHKVTTAVAMGNSAAEALLRKTGIMKLRIGPGQYGTILPDIKIIPTVHPAACLRQGDQFPNLVTDIGKINYARDKWTAPEYIIADTENNAIELLNAIEQRLDTGIGLIENPERVLVLDIEVDIEKDTAFGHPNQYGMLCVGIGFDRSKVLVLSESVMDSKSVRSRLRDLFTKYKLVAQNGKFDLAGLYPLLGGLKLYFDTMLASYVFDERSGVHGLKFMAVEYLGAPQYDEEIKRYVGPRDGYGVIPRDILYKYNAYDVACTYDLYLMWLNKFNDPEFKDLREVHDMLVRASNELMYVELNGISIDRKYLEELNKKYVASLAELESQIAKTIGRNINPRSPMQIKAYFADMGIGVDSTNEATLELILAKQNLPSLIGEENAMEVISFVQQLLHHRGESKTYGTYIKGIAKRAYRGRVYPSFLLHGTTTGRLSCRNPNMQNIPRASEIRGIFVPSKDDNIFIQADYSQAELRVLSYLANDSYFRAIFNAGELDVFDELTPILYPDAKKPKLDAPKEEHAAWKELRIRVKAYVYGLAYGRSEFSIATEFDITVNEARKGMERFFDVIPEIVAFRNNTRQAVLNGEDLITPWGRHRRYALITEENKQSILNEALAFLPQSTASDMCLTAMTHTRQDTKGFAYIRNIVHDSILIECAAEDEEEVRTIVERNMLEAAYQIVGDFVKFKVDSKTGKNWGEV